MERRLLVVFALLGSLAGIALLVWLLLQPPPRVELAPTVEPPGSTPPPPEDDQKAVREEGTLRGMVVNGVSGQRIPGATVIALRPYLQSSADDDLPLWGEMQEVKRVVTAADGTFALEDLPPDYWNLWVEKRGYAWTTLPRAKFAEEHRIELFPGCSIRGKVVYEDDSPAPGVSIEYTPQGTHSEVFSRYRRKAYFTETRGDGTFEYLDIPPGKFTVEVYPRDHLPAPWTTEPPLDPGENRDLGIRKLHGGFGMKVWVKYRGSNEPVAGVEVKVLPIGDPMPRTKVGQTRRTNTDGLALFRGLGGQVIEKPQFQVVAHAPDPVLPDEQRLFAPNEEVTIYLRKEGIVKGRVQRPNGDPLERFAVDLEAQGFRTRQLRVWGEDGEFTIHQVPEGSYTVHIRYGNLVDASVPVTVQPGEEADLGVVTLTEGAEIRGTVRRSDGGELDEIVKVHLARKVPNEVLGRDDWETVARAYVKKDTTYSLRGVPEGEFWIWPEPARPLPTTRPVRVVVEPRTGLLEVDLVIQGAGYLDLVFVDLVGGSHRQVVPPKCWLTRRESGEEMAYFGAGQALLPGTWDLDVELPGEDGSPVRHENVRSFEIQEGAAPGPIEIPLYEIRRNGRQAQER